jgi:ppGpp synthetase/RelA/SpoT-type nucleotidyltranferase
MDLDMGPASKIELLIQTHFPWGQPGFPQRPTNTPPMGLASAASNWIIGRLVERGCDNTALALHARLQAVLDELVGALPTDERSRLFYRTDFSSLVKSPESILDKMVRDWNPGAAGPQLGFDNFLDEMEDLARFRFVFNFLSDVESVSARIEAPYQCSQQEQKTLTAAQLALFNDFALKGHRLRDLINLPPDVRKSGERCRKGVFYPKRGTQVRVEVQIQTMLEEAWDKKDHFLIYEWRRSGKPVDTNHLIEMYAMSELLYVADRTFDGLLRDIRRRRDPGA